MTSASAMLWCASEATTVLPSMPTTATRPMPITMIVISSSTSVSPRSSRTECISDLHLAEDAVHRGYECDRDEADDATGDDDDEWLEEAREALELVVELAVEVDRRRLHLLVEASRVLTDAEHLACGGRKETRRRQRTGETLSAKHRLARRLEALSIDPVVGGIARHDESVGQRDTSCDHRGEDPAEPLEDRVADEVPDDGQLQHEAIAPD